MTDKKEEPKIYSLLFDSEKFATAIGRMTLETGRLEMMLKSYLQNNGIKVDRTKDSLGLLIAKAGSISLLDKVELSKFNNIRKKRNYLTHNIYSTMSHQNCESNAKTADLKARDVDSYIEQVTALTEDISELIKLVSAKQGE